MPEVTEYKPHAISCIKRSVFELLQEWSGDNLTISCDRDDCWSDPELFKWRQAVNIVTGADIVGDPVRRDHGRKRQMGVVQEQPTDQCWHECSLQVDVQIYVQQCDTESDCMSGKEKAYAILGHITHIFTSYQSQIVARRILYQGSSHQSDSTGDVDLDVVTGSFQVSYLFDQTRPWVVGK